MNTIWATVDYVAKDGIRIDLAGLEGALEDIAMVLEDKADSARGKTKEALRDAAEAVRELIPDRDAMQPEPDPIAEAQAFLMQERLLAQELLNTEAARMRKESTIKAAFCIPDGLLSRVIQALLPGVEHDEFKAANSKVEAIFEDAGWRVYSYASSLSSNKAREPLRQLARLIEDFPRSSLTSHALAVIHYALRWCENVSYAYVSPITGKAQNGVPPDGVLFPRISMELVKVESSQDIPKEWREPLVPK